MVHGHILPLTCQIFADLISRPLDLNIIKLDKYVQYIQLLHIQTFRITKTVRIIGFSKTVLPFLHFPEWFGTYPCHLYNYVLHTFRIVYALYTHK